MFSFELKKIDKLTFMLLGKVHRSQRRMPLVSRGDYEIVRSRRLKEFTEGVFLSVPKGTKEQEARGGQDAVTGEKKGAGGPSGHSG